MPPTFSHESVLKDRGKRFEDRLKIDKIDF